MIEEWLKQFNQINIPEKYEVYKIDNKNFVIFGCLGGLYVYKDDNRYLFKEIGEDDGLYFLRKYDNARNICYLSDEIKIRQILIEYMYENKFRY